MFPKDTKILVVDDMSTMRKLVIKQLKDAGFTDITDKDDGASAWQAVEKAVAEKKPFQLIISDWNMPKMSGLELLMKVRSSAATKNLPFIMLTAESENHQLDKANQLHVTGYITKPFTPAQLVERLTEAYGKAKKAA